MNTEHNLQNKLSALSINFYNSLVSTDSYYRVAQ